VNVLLGGHLLAWVENTPRVKGLLDVYEKLVDLGAIHGLETRGVNESVPMLP
jgi:hypothetical protein